MNVTASTRTHGFGHIIWKTGGEKSENSPEIEYLGNRMPHKINFHSLQFLKNCLHKTPENFFCGSRQKAHRTICYLLTTFKGHGEPLARLHYDFSHPLIFRPAFYGLRLWQMRPQATSTTTTPNHDAKPQHQFTTSSHNIKPQTFTTPGRKTHNRNQFIAMSGKIRTFA